MLQIGVADPRARKPQSLAASNPLKGKKIYIPPMAYGSARAFAAGFRAIGLDAEPTPPSDHRTRELGARYTSGDECYPAKVTVGDFMKVLRAARHRTPRSTVLFMPTAEGPCRFGQYAPYLRHILDANGYKHIEILAPSSKNAYQGLGDLAGRVRAHRMARAAGRRHPAEDAAAAPAVRAAEGRRPTRSTRSAWTICAAPSRTHPPTRQLQLARHSREPDALAATASARVPTQRDHSAPLIGVVGEIFCRLNTFSNENLIRRLEEYGAEAWLSRHRRVDLVHHLRAFPEAQAGRAASSPSKRSAAWIRKRVQKHDEHVLMEPFQRGFHRLRGAGHLRDPGVRAALPAARRRARRDGAERGQGGLPGAARAPTASSTSAPSPA